MPYFILAIRIYTRLARIIARKWGLQALTYASVMWFVVLHIAIAAPVQRWEVFPWAGITLTWQYSFHKMRCAYLLSKGNADAWQAIAVRWRSYAKALNAASQNGSDHTYWLNDE